MRIVIIEDEPRAARRLEKMILDIEPAAHIINRLESVKESLVFFNTHPEVDLIFSDIQLADNLSFEIYAQTEINAPIIFTTAYDSYAIEAFKTNGIDYLLKPVKPEDLEKAIAKFKHLTKKESNPDLKALAAIIQNAGNAQNTQYKKRFMVKVGTQLKSIAVADVLAFYSKEKANYIFTSDKRSYVLESSLDFIETELNPEHFFRINRGFILSLAAANNIVAYSNSRLKITINGLEDELIIVARDRTKAFKSWLGE